MAEIMEIVVRVVIAFFMTLIIARLIGRQMIAQLSYHDYVAAIIIGSIAGNLAFNIKIKLGYFLLSLLLFSAIALAVTVISLKNDKLKRWVTGEAMVVIDNGTILRDNLKKLNYTLQALELGLREKGVFDKQEVQTAILEINGSLSVLKKPEYNNVTKKELTDILKKLQSNE